MNIAVFCASAEKISEEYKIAACRLGKEIAVRKWGLVYGGTNCGLMKEVAEAVLKGEGNVTGIIPHCIVQKGVCAVDLPELIEVEDMKERKAMMRERADAFIALPGGWGTLEEITEVITLKQLGIHRKPVVFLNINGFYDRFFVFLQEAKRQGFIAEAYEGLYAVVDEPEKALEYIARYVPHTVISKY